MEALAMPPQQAFIGHVAQHRVLEEIDPLVARLGPDQVKLDHHAQRLAQPVWVGLAECG